MVDLRKALRTPRGMAWLFGITLGLAIGLALLMAGTRFFFERYVREKYRAPSPAAVDLIAHLRAGDAGPRAIERLKPECADAYAVWMTADGAEGDEVVARAIVSADPARIAALVRTTFAAGSQAQKRRAARLARLGPHPELIPVLQRALVRAEATSNTELARAIMDALPARGSGG